MGRTKILVVDDDPVCAGMLLSVLGEDYEVLSANSGSGAINLLGSFLPQLIFLDITMPDINGYHVLKYIKDELDSPIPVVVISSLDEEFDKEFAIKLGANDYVIKPILPDTIFKLVTKYL